MTTDIQRDWDAGWKELDTTISDKDVWLLTDQIKLHYLMKLVSPGTRSLEVGCGSAKLSALLAAKGLRVVGMDQSSQALRVARNNFAWLGIQGDRVLGNAFRLPFADAQFDVVLSTGLLEHFKDPIPVIAEMVRTLRPGGVFFSDVAPLKFSLLRMGFYLRGYHRQVQDEYAHTPQEIHYWLEECELDNIRVFSSGIVPPLGLVRHIPLVRHLCFRGQAVWTILDDTVFSDWLGFFYLTFATKRRQPIQMRK